MKWAALTKPITRAGLFIRDSCDVRADKCASRSAEVKLRCTGLPQEWSSSPAKARDPVNTGVRDYWVARSSRAMTGELATAAPRRWPRSPPARLFRPAAPPGPAPLPDSARRISRDISGQVLSDLPDI